jgi:branched-chain amino acid transport system ATP-binding protein
MSAAQPVLVVEGLHVGYGRADVLHGVDLALMPGRVTALMGANGAGKTSLLKAIMGLVPLSSGDIRLRGGSIAGRNATHMATLGLALVPEGRGIFPSQTVEANLLAAAWPIRARRRKLHDSAAQMYERFPLLARRRRARAGSLSGGEARILSIAMALMIEPQVLLLDEPSLGLAPVMIDSVLDVIEALRDEGRTILLVEQNAQAALAVSDDGHLLHLGRVVSSGRPEDLVRHEDLQEAYLGSKPAGGTA